MQAKLRFIDQDGGRHEVFWLKQHCGQTNKTQSAIRQRACLEWHVLPRLRPLQLNLVSVARIRTKKEVTKERSDHLNRFDDALVVGIVVLLESMQECRQIAGILPQVFVVSHTVHLFHQGAGAGVMKMVHPPAAHCGDSMRPDHSVPFALFEARLEVSRSRMPFAFHVPPQGFVGKHHSIVLRRLEFEAVAIVAKVQLRV